MALEFKKHIGASIKEIIHPLAELRITVFHDFPYLYDGNIEFEENYLSRYANIEQGFVFSVWDQDTLVGAATGMPMKNEMKSIQFPFEEKNWDMESIFYFGESILLESYRGQGIGHRFFNEREVFALENGYQTTAFCSVNRPETHPLKPENYRSNEVFWQKRGYTKDPSIICHMNWLDRGEEIETEKPLEFWYRKW